ncbi:MAG: hypothetical protein IJ461_10405, partial [Clostridia bacterium]|nr:hypothetical protein [Clostridia bacterium]
YILDTEELASDVQRSLPMYDAVDEVRIKLELADNRLIWWEGREDVTVLNELDSKRLLDEISSIGYGGERIMTIEKAEATEIPLATSTPAPLRTLEPREYSLSSTPAPRVAN